MSNVIELQRTPAVKARVAQLAAATIALLNESAASQSAEEELQREISAIVQDIRFARMKLTAIAGAEYATRMLHNEMLEAKSMIGSQSDKDTP